LALGLELVAAFWLEAIAAKRNKRNKSVRKNVYHIFDSMNP